jgi:hypothetical protein
VLPHIVMIELEQADEKTSGVKQDQAKDIK